MKLSDMMTNDMCNLLQRCDMTDVKFHTDDDGKIKAIEVKYTPHNDEVKGDVRPSPRF